jgi:hypothetical protein
MPEMQALPGGQSVPHEPQLVGSVDSVEQTGPIMPMHVWRAGAHGPSHAPCTQADPGAHRLPHAPQLLASENLSEQTSPAGPGQS